MNVLREKRTNQLTAEEIQQMEKGELPHWMNRIMSRLYKLVERPKYDELSKTLITVSRSIQGIKSFLVGAVNLIKEIWPPQGPRLHLV
jgi:hypothetical protein